MTNVKTHLRDPGVGLEAKRVRMAPYDVEVGPLGHLAAERERLDALTWEAFDVERMSATLGATVSGVDLAADLPQRVVDELRRALLDYKVLFFRDQPLTAAQHVAFARRFGELEVHPFYAANAEYPELVRLAKSADVGGYENLWHSDVSFREVPSMASVLHAIDVPLTGGDTLFADMYAAYDGLPAEVRERIDGMVAEHDYMRPYGRQVAPEQRDEMRARYPQVEHPVVRTHPETGRKLLYVNRFFVNHIVGLDPAESLRLLEHLCRQAELIEYQCRFHWAKDSVAMWDNRAVQHYACSDYWPSVRVMERASVVGERPV